MAGTNEAQVYFASHQMNVFDKKTSMPIFGRVVDLNGNLITDPKTPMEVILQQPYGKGCVKQLTVPVVSNGFFETSINLVSDKRNFKTKVKLNSGPEYLKIEQHIDQVNFIDTAELFLQIQTVSSTDRMLAGVYKFRVNNAIDYVPISDVSGDYSMTSKETARWRSDRNGEVFLDHLKVGLTNIVFKNDPDFYNFVISGAKVKKGEESKQATNGRPAMLVPRTLKDNIVFTMTWVGAEF